MRYVILVCLLGLAIAVDLAVFIASTGEAFEAFDPYHPSTLLPILTQRLRAAADGTGEMVRDLVEGFTAPFRERVHRTLPTEPGSH